MITKRIRHGKCHTLEYKIWKSMRRRCSSQKSADYPRYGGRGITVCESWQKSFMEFITDMGTRPTATHSLGRINNDGNYTKENCRWATLSEQGRNKRPRKSVAGIRGVTINPSSKKYVASVWNGSKRIYLGQFDTAVEAGIIYAKARSELFGD